MIMVGNWQNWDQARADELSGKTVYVTLRYVEGASTRVERYWGVLDPVERALPIRLRCQGRLSGRVIELPNELSAFNRTRPGFYDLPETQEVVRNPDYHAEWTIHSNTR